MLLGTSALAKDNIYAYNKFVSTVLGPQTGYCDTAASFAGHEAEYDDVNDYFSGLISAFYDDIDADLNNELITVDTHGVTVYRMEENGVAFLGSVDTELIANFGDSYANVFTVPEGKKQYIGVEVYGKTANIYNMYMYELDAETDDFNKILEIIREDNEDGIEEKVWAVGKTYYSHTEGGGISATVPSPYADCSEAASAALKDLAPGIKLDGAVLKGRITGTAGGSDFRLNADGINQKTYIRATGVRFAQRPVVFFEDYTQLAELKIVPDIVTVVVDGQTLQFPTQDPIIIEGRTLVPMRTIFEALGAEVLWNDENGVQTITATTEDITISMTINSAEFFVNGESKTLDVPAQLINDKTMVPLRAIGESFGCGVDWNQDTKTVTITSNT